MLEMDELKINEDFAKKYNKYREREELQKLKSRYGDVDSTENSSESESEDENAAALTPGLERDFLRTLAYLKKKDPAIYDKTKTFYEEPESDESSSSTENNKQKVLKPMFLKDYERKVILENEGKFLEDESDDDEEQQTKEASPSYHQEQMKLKEDILKALKKVKDEEEGLLTKRTKSPKEKEKEEEEFRKWLKTPDSQLDIIEKPEDPTSSSKMLLAVAEEVAPLKQYWTDPNLDEGETFLRDYILERKYMDPNEDGETPTYDEIVGVKSGNEIDDSEDELFEKKSERFEHKYNFRFQEPDQELIKSFPRTIGASVRRKEDIRKKKREKKKKKDEEKKRKKQEELKQLKALKKKEILAKIKRLQETTGNKDMAFSEADLEVDFDPEQYDKRMQEIFSNYDDDFDGEKPVISDIEDEMEDYEKYWDDELEHAGGEQHEADCDNPDFIMDCDYDPVEHQRRKEQQKSKKNLRPNATERDKKTKKSPFFDSVAKQKPTFDPNEKSFEKYLDEYYALDYEDLIGDLPCRFKYRQVVPNDFGLSTDEVLAATDKELNTWCSLKCTVQYRKEEDERRDVKKYQRKSKDVWKKARILKTVYKMPGEDEENKSDNVEGRQEGDGVPRKTKMNSRKRRRLKERAQKLKLLEDDIPGTALQQNAGLRGTEGLNAQQHKNFENVSERPEAEKKSSKYVARKRRDDPFNKVSKLSDDRLKAYGLEPKKFLKKMKYGTANTGL